jgi:hypothetical protein
VLRPSKRPEPIENSLLSLVRRARTIELESATPSYPKAPRGVTLGARSGSKHRQAPPGTTQGGASRGRRKGRGREREGEGRGSHLGVQIRQSPSPKPRAQWGEREVEEGKSLRGKKLTEGNGRDGRGHAPGEGRGARGMWARVGPSWVAPRVKSPRHAQPLFEIQSRNENRNVTRQTRD